MALGGGLFGLKETLHCIQDVTLKGRNGEELCLAYKTSGYFFFAGVYLSDDGYVLKVKRADLYYPLTESNLKEYRAAGYLPAQLPPYKVAIGDYLFGYSLWILLAASVIYDYIKRRVSAYRARG